MSYSKSIFLPLGEEQAGKLNNLSASIAVLGPFWEEEFDYPDGPLSGNAGWTHYEFDTSWDINVADGKALGGDQGVWGASNTGVISSLNTNLDWTCMVMFSLDYTAAMQQADPVGSFTYFAIGDVNDRFTYWGIGPAADDSHARIAVRAPGQDTLVVPVARDFNASHTVFFEAHNNVVSVYLDGVEVATQDAGGPLNLANNHFSISGGNSIPGETDPWCRIDCIEFWGVSSVTSDGFDVVNGPAGAYVWTYDSFADSTTYKISFMVDGSYVFGAVVMPPGS